MVLVGKFYCRVSKLQILPLQKISWVFYIRICYISKSLSKKYPHVNFKRTFHLSILYHEFITIKLQLLPFFSISCVAWWLNFTEEFFMLLRLLYNTYFQDFFLFHFHYFMPFLMLIAILITDTFYCMIFILEICLYCMYTVMNKYCEINFTLS